MERKRVLVVDDNIVIRELLALSLDEYDVEVASNGKEAMKLMSSKNDFDCVITDYEMPEMYGLELLKHCKNVLNIPVIMMSGRIEMVKTAMSNGAAAFFSKPFNPDVLIEELDHLFAIAI